MNKSNGGSGQILRPAEGQTLEDWFALILNAALKQAEEQKRYRARVARREMFIHHPHPNS